MNAVMAYLSSITPLDVGGVEGKFPLSSSTSRVNALKTEYGQDSSSAALPDIIKEEERQIHVVARNVVHSTLKCSTH